MDALRAAIETAKSDVAKRKRAKQLRKDEAEAEAGGGAATGESAAPAAAAETTDASAPAATEESEERPSKYVKRGDLKKLTVELTRDEKAAAADAKKLAREAAKSRGDPFNESEYDKQTVRDATSSAASSSSAASKGAAAAAAAAPARVNIPAIEVKRRLRVLGEPITLFGESDDERLERLKLVEVKHHERTTSSMGRKAEYQDIAKQVQDEIDKAILSGMESGAGSSSSASASSSSAAAATDDSADGAAGSEAANNSKKEAKSEEEKAKAKHAKQMAKYEVDKDRSEFKHATDYCLHFLKRMLRLWERELDERTDEEKRSAKGKIASTAQKQTRQYVKPLLTLLKDRTISDEILRSTEKIVTLCRQREYVMANQVYLTLAIGNAPWPMGVTMVGIHERAGREKIFSQHTGHVLNDEGQRKYIQALKRLMTFSQHAFPTYGPPHD